MKVRNHKTRKGFTLIELLVVIMILAVLAALIVPRVMNKQDDAKRAKAASDIQALSSALKLFKLDVGHYPESEEGLQALRQAPADATNWDGPYTDDPIPTDPWQSNYVYELRDADNFVIMSYGADKAPGGEGDNADIARGLDEDQSASQ